MRVREKILARFRELKQEQIESAKKIRAEAEIMLKQAEALSKEVNNASSSSQGEGQKLLVDRRKVDGKSKGTIKKQDESATKRERQKRSKTRMEADETEKVK